MGLFSDDDIDNIEEALVLARKNPSYIQEFLTGFENNWQAMESQKIDLTYEVHKGIERIPERLKTMGTTRPLFVGKDIGTLIGMFHYHSVELLKEEIVLATIPPIRALYTEGEHINGKPIFSFYIRHLVWQWEKEILKKLKKNELTGRQALVFKQYRNALCLRE